MAGEPTKTGFDYLGIAQQGRTFPQLSQGEASNAIEVPPILKKEEKEPPYPFARDEEIPEDPQAQKEVAIAVTMKANSKVFILWRDWNTCDRCAAALGSGHVVLPQDTGDYTCPHVTNIEYVELLSRCIDGKGIISLKEVFTLPDGTRCAHVEWLVDDPELRRKAEAAAAKKKKNQVYPPQPFPEDDDD